MVALLSFWEKSRHAREAFGVLIVGFTRSRIVQRILRIIGRPTHSVVVNPWS